MPRRIIDCTKQIQHGSDEKFVAREFERTGEPRTIGHRIEMDSDIGTHVIAGRRFASWGSAIGGLQVDKFFGEGVIGKIPISSEAPDIDADKLDAAFGRRLQNGDIAILVAVVNGGTPRLTAQATQWLLVRGIKLLALADDIEIGREREPDDERVILSVLLENDIPVVRNLRNTADLSEERLACMALPAAVADVAAWPVRFVVLDPGHMANSEQALEDPERAFASDEPVSQEVLVDESSTTVSDAETLTEESAQVSGSLSSLPDPAETEEQTESNNSDKKPEAADQNV
jgi:kynurenine formamidase